LVQSIPPMAASVICPLNTSGANTSAASESNTRSFNSSSNENSESTNNTLQAESLPNVTVREFLERFSREVEAKILAKADEMKQKVMDEFHKEKALLLSEAKRLKIGSKAPLKVVSIEVIGGENGPKKVKVKVGGDKALVAKVGRSRGAQFVEGKGISLHWDKETSTTHGQFIMKEDQLWFEDLHSTNMTSLLTQAKTTIDIGKTREAMAAPINNGDQLNVGACKLKIVSIGDADA
jgi:hypothetical protein